MSVYHLISVSEDQLRDWRGDRDDLLRNIGSAVVIACLDPENKDVSICADGSDAHSEQAASRITVNHVDKYRADAFSVWAWSTGDSVCIADLQDQDLDLIIKLAHAVRTQAVHDPGKEDPSE
ncbi:hypothetical protein [Rhodanobacter sp. C03]|uniref:hypothetical protein n=1 Tax=Rhodanobacter sp. C03 TaxID=1945858 RepID=UPI0009853A57|nr:hypothetical protein [Rhodanobacter sp. C03]OOG60063.1 hypothetical protein B0E48_04690 [Rhodanobacter sp. C03]